MIRVPAATPLLARLRVLLVVLVGLPVVAMLAVARPALADDSSEASAALAAFSSGQHVYVSADAGQQVDVAAVEDAIGDDPVFVAVVPPNTPPNDVLVQLREGAQDAGTYVVISGTEQAAQSSAICSTQAQPLLDDAAAAQSDSRSGGDLTAFLTDYVDRLDSAPAPGDDDCSDEVDDSGSFLSAVPWILGALVIGIGGGLLWLRHRHGVATARRTNGRRTVASALDELARDIDGVHDESDPQVAAALHDARERHIAAADILAEADAAADFDAALRAAREGAVAAHFARSRAGLPTERPAEVEPVRARRVSASEPVDVGDEHLMAYREYRPGATHFFAGSEELPAGWYTGPVGSPRLLGAIADDE